MIRALTFTETSRPIQLPTMTEGINNGLQIILWVRRTGSGSRQRILQLGTASGGYVVLGTGDRDNSLALGIEQGGTRRELVCEGALPLNRWVKVTALLFSSFQLAKLSVYDIDLGQQPIGEFPAGPLTECSIGRGVAGRPFVGSLSGLEIWQLPPLSWGKQQPSVLWGKYPLNGLKYQKTLDTPSGPVKRYLVDDTSAKNHDGVIDGELSKPQFSTPLAGGPIPVLEQDGVGKTLFLSPIQNLRGKLTLETWFNPTSVTPQQSMIILGDDREVSLVVAVSGSTSTSLGTIEVLLCRGSERLSLLQTAHTESAGTFQHLAVTFAQGGPVGLQLPIVLSLYLNGQFQTNRTVMSPLSSGLPGMTGQQFLPLQKLLQSKVVPHVRLGGTVAGLPKFKGQLAEFRIWDSCRSAQEIAASFLNRVVGNEPGLLACYRLEQSLTGCVFDCSEQRGLGTLQTGSTIGTARNLPLVHTSDPGAAHLRVKGKLVSEYMVYLADVVNIVEVPGGTIEGSTTTVITQEQRSGRVTVFDATLEPVSPDGSSEAGSAIQVCPDGDVRVFLERDDKVYVPTTWKAKQIYSVTVPPSGKLRLRFQANDLTFPTLRARYGDMVEGVWTLVRSDSDALLGLAYANGTSLRTPPPGKPSPLPAGTSQEEANRCATALVHIGRCYRPIPYSESQLVGEARGILGDLADAWDQVTDWTESATSAAGSTLKKAGASAGKFAEALVDDGKVALSRAASVPKRAGELLSTASDDLHQLVNATTDAVPRFGRDQIKQCIASADRLAVMSTAAANTLSHTFSIIGTTIIDGVTYAWRVVVNGVLDAYAATVELLKKIGATIEKIIEYLAWLFKWDDFLAASDKIYALIQGEFGKAKDRLAGLDRYKDSLNQYLSLPEGIGEKSLAEHCGIKIPEDLGAEELDYFLELAQQVMGATSLRIDGVDQLSQSVGSTLPIKDLSRLQTLDGSTSGSPAGSLMSNPVALINTPVQDLLNGVLTGSQQTPVVDYMFEQVTSVTSELLSSAQTVLTSRLSVPNMTSWIESSILRGRTLSVLRIVSLAAGIAQVLAVKITASARSGEARPQPVSFADNQPADYAEQVWAGFALGIALALLQIPRSLADLALSKAGSSEAVEAAETAALPKTLLLDMGIALVLLARSGLSYYSNARLPEEVQTTLGLMSAMEALSAGNLMIMSLAKAYTLVNRAKMGRVWVKIVKGVDLLVQTILTGGSVLAAIVASQTQGAFNSAADWTSFGLQVGSYICGQATTFSSALVEFDPRGKISPYTPIVLAVSTVALDLGSSITTVVNNT